LNTLKSFQLTGHHLIFQDELLSTNNYATRLLASKKVEEGTVVLTFRQLKGRGHGKNVWESADFKNLTFSLVLFPGFLPANKQFLLSQVVSLGLYDFLSGKTSGVTIKWPNDLLIHGKKVAGILIENSVLGENLHSTVIGIGININQIVFPDHLPHATSLAIETGKEYALEETCQLMLQEIMKWYQVLKNQQMEKINDWYLKHLFRKGEKSYFQKDNLVFEAEILGIDHYGQLLLKNSSDEIKVFPFKSVEMIL
jgi:BirA family transcriptional regulator, biotin operon repressor / biotin---[acetyl-CoA-carboxylase] ligase